MDDRPWQDPIVFARECKVCEPVTRLIIWPDWGVDLPLCDETGAYIDWSASGLSPALLDEFVDWQAHYIAHCPPGRSWDSPQSEDWHLDRAAILLRRASDERRGSADVEIHRE